MGKRHGNQLNENIALERVLEKCKESDIKFRGWVGGIYRNNKTKLILHCEKHNIEWKSVSYNTFVKKTPLCSICRSIKMNTIFKANENEVLKNILNICKNKKIKFNGFVDGEYQNHYTKLKLECGVDGYKWESCTYSKFLHGRGCPKCGGKLKIDINIALSNINKQCEKLNYKFIDFLGGEWITPKKTYLILSCPKHGEWNTTPYTNFVNEGNGCPKCKESYLERDGRLLLNSYNISYIPQHTFEWLRHENNLLLDFYLPDYNIAIECQGEQHFNKFRFEKNNQQLKKRQLRDKIKKRLCEENGVKLYYVNYNENTREKLNKILKENKII